MGVESTVEQLREELKVIVIEAVMLQITPADLADTQPLFGPSGLGLDSVDALQLVVALDKHYGIKITDAEVAQHVLATVSSMADAIVQHRATPGRP